MANRVKILNTTVNSEILQGLYFRVTSLIQSFMKIKPLQDDEITLSFTYFVHKLRLELTNNHSWIIHS